MLVRFETRVCGSHNNGGNTIFYVWPIRQYLIGHTGSEWSKQFVTCGAMQGESQNVLHRVFLVCKLQTKHYSCTQPVAALCCFACAVFPSKRTPSTYFTMAEALPSDDVSVEGEEGQRENLATTQAVLQKACKRRRLSTNDTKVMLS
jgi:hypothetical protein